MEDRAQKFSTCRQLWRSGGASLTKTGRRVKDKAIPSGNCPRKDRPREDCSVETYGHEALRIRERWRRGSQP